MKDRSSEGEKYRSSECKKDRSSEGKKDRSSEGEKDRSSEGKKDRSTGGKKNRSSEGTKETEKVLLHAGRQTMLIGGCFYCKTKQQRNEGRTIIKGRKEGSASRCENIYIYTHTHQPPCMHK